MASFSLGDSDAREGNGGDRRDPATLALGKDGSEKIAYAIIAFTPPGKQRGGAMALSRATGYARQTLLDWSKGVVPPLEALRRIDEALEKLRRGEL